MTAELMETLKFILERCGDPPRDSAFIPMSDFPREGKPDEQLAKLYEEGMITKPLFYDNGVRVTLTQEGRHFFDGVAFPPTHSPMTCPVCGYRAKVASTDAARSWAEIECENCTTYAIKKDALQGIDPSELAMLSGYYRHVHRAPLTVQCDSQETVKARIASVKQQVTREYQIKSLLRYYYQKMSDFGKMVPFEALPAIAYAADKDDLMGIVAEAVEKGYVNFENDMITVTRQGKAWMDATENRETVRNTSERADAEDLPDFEKDRARVRNKTWRLVPKSLRTPVAVLIEILLVVATIAGIISLILAFRPTPSTTESQSLVAEESIEPQFVSVQVTKEYSDHWSDTTSITKDELAKCKVVFTNEKRHKVKNVVLTCVLTDNIAIVDGATIYNDAHPDGVALEGQLENVGVNIGDYPAGGTAEIDFYIRAIDPDIENEECITVSVSVDGITYQQAASVRVRDPNGGWGDNTNGRQDYTEEEIAAGKLGNAITFNSISDGKIGHEFNYVGAKGVDEDGPWHADSLEVEDGQVYVIRLYVHNNNPNGYHALAKDVKAYFGLPEQFSKEQTITGYLESSNAIPSRYWDSVTLKSDQYFYVEYLEGSAVLFNCGISADGGVTLPDEIITKDGTVLGYSALDGLIPGGYEYDGEVRIYVQVHMKK